MLRLHYTVCFLLFINHYSFSQNINWQVISPQNATTHFATKTSDGNYLLAGNHLKSYSPSGELIWSRNDLDFNTIIGSVELEDSRLLHIERRGGLFTTNNFSSPLTFLKNLDVNWVNRVQRWGNRVYILGAGNNSNAVCLEIDINTLEVQNELSQPLRSTQPNGFFTSIYPLQDSTRLLVDENGQLKKLDATNNIIWSKQIEETATGNIQLFEVISNNGRIYVSGQIGKNAYIAALDGTGDEIWKQTFAPEFQRGDAYYRITRMKALSNGELICTGEDGFTDFYPSSYLAILRISILGEVRWNIKPTLYSGGHDYAVELFPEADGRMLIAGSTGGRDDARPFSFLLELKDNLTTPIEEIAASEVFDLNILPNPASTHLQIHSEHFDDIKQIELFDIHGKKIHLHLQIENQQIDIHALQAGIYFFKAVSSTGTLVRKWIKS